jgi:hypothetical protein
LPSPPCRPGHNKATAIVGQDSLNLKHLTFPLPLCP